MTAEDVTGVIQYGDGSSVPGNRFGVTAPVSRYARTTESTGWLQVSSRGFVSAITASITDGRDRIVLAWPFRPDNGFVAAAIGLRESRNTADHATIGLWPWRSAAMHAARSILVNASDIASRATRGAAILEDRRRVSPQSFAQDSLCLVELRLRDLIRKKPSHEASQRGRATAPQYHPTLLETTPVFEPIEKSPQAPYETDSGQILKRVRRHTRVIPSEHAAKLGDPMLTPFALMGLPKTKTFLERCLSHERFARYGMDVVVVYLTRASKNTLSTEWAGDLKTLLSVLDNAKLPRRTPIVVVCEDGYVMRGAETTLNVHAFHSTPRRERPLRKGALLESDGILEVPAVRPAASSGTDLPPISFDADIKDATLRPLRERLLSLARNIRTAGHSEAAAGVVHAIRVLSRFASLPLGISEAKSTASVLFDGDGRDEVRARATFFPTHALQRLADAEVAAPEFAQDIREVLDEAKVQIARWDGETPVSLKLRSILQNEEWNAADVAVVVPNTRLAEVFSVSDAGIGCRSAVIDAHTLGQEQDGRWRRLIVIRPEPKILRALLTFLAAPERVLFLGDCVGISLVILELEQIASIADFARFAKRARNLIDALKRGGSDDSAEFADADFQYRFAPTEQVIDLAKANDGYAGPVVRFELEGGARADYRPTGDVLLYTPEDARPFTRVSAQEVNVGDDILVLGREIRDQLATALSRSRKTVAQLRVYHQRIADYRQSLPGDTLRAKAKRALALMRDIDPSIGDHELLNIIRWLSVEPSDAPQPPRAARDRRRFRVFMESAGMDQVAADAFWDLAILPVRTYSTMEGHAFNRRVIQFIIDPEGVAAGNRWREYRGLWQMAVDSVERVVRKTTHE